MSPHPGDHRVRDMVASAVRARIGDGTYPPGTRLPVRKHVADELGCSVTAVGSAWRQLEREGLVQLLRNEVAVVRDHAEEEALLLAALRLVFGGLYQITANATGFEAWRTDGSGTLVASTVRELAPLILADHPKYAHGIPL